MRSLRENGKGITLVSLVITIVVLLILASIATYTGIEVIKSSRLTTFTTEMKIMQTQVNKLYQEMKDGDTTIKELGKEISKIDQTQVNNVFKAVGIISIEEREKYRYFDQDIIKNLNIEGISGTFLVNIEKRSVISYEGFQDGDEIYYTLEQLPNGLYNVEYEDKSGEITLPVFDTSVESIGDNKWRITVSNIQYGGYIDKWQVKYKLEESDNWNTSEDLSFIVEQEGCYNIKIANSNIESEIKGRWVYGSYIKDGIVLYLDGIDNTRMGHNQETTVWEDLSGNEYDYTLSNVSIEKDSMLFNGVSTSYAENIQNVKEIFGKNYNDVRTIEIVIKPIVYNRGVVLTSGNLSKKAFGLLNSTILTCCGNTISDYKPTLTITTPELLHNYTLTFSENETTGYQDGKKLSTSSDRTNYWTINSNVSHIGKRDTGNDSYNGKVMAIRVYNRILTDEEIQHNYELDRERFGIE